MKVIGYSIDDHVIANSENEYAKVVSDNILDFLSIQKKDVIRVFYHIDLDIANLLRHLHITEKQGKELLVNTYIKYGSNGIKLKYIPRKLFSIKDSKHFTYYGNISPYNEQLDVSIFNSSFIHATEAKRIGEEVFKILNELGLEPTSLVNPSLAYFEALESGKAPVGIKMLCQLNNESVGIKKKVIEQILENTVNCYATEKLIPITLGIAVSSNMWDKLGQVELRS